MPCIKLLQAVRHLHAKACAFREKLFAWNLRVRRFSTRTSQLTRSPRNPDADRPRVHSRDLYRAGIRLSCCCATITPPCGASCTCGTSLGGHRVLGAAAAGDAGGQRPRARLAAHHVVVAFHAQDYRMRAPCRAVWANWCCRGHLVVRDPAHECHCVHSCPRPLNLDLTCVHCA